MDAQAALSKPVARKTNAAFRMDCAVSCNIKASRERIWALLTDADGFPRWNSTVTSLKGPIALGQKLEIRVPLAPKRVFTPKVTKLETASVMEWSDGMAPMFKGVRTFTLSAKPDGSTDFAMDEVFAGVMLPMIKGSLPDFGPAFETYASDLKREAEKAP
jgi:hypothetical protein